MTAQTVSELVRFRELVAALTIREVKVRYKQTVLGIAWAIIQPAALTLIFTLVFGVFLKIGSQSAPYSLFAYSGLLPWTFFANAVSFGTLSVINNGNLVTKVYFPREILPISSVAAAFFDFLMASSIFIVMFLANHVNVNANIFYIILIVPVIFLLTLGVTFFFSALNVLFRDIRFVVPLLLQIWLYLTPVIYSPDQVPAKFQMFFRLNPMAALIGSFRDVTIFGKTPNMQELVIAIFYSFLIFFAGYWFFKSKEKIFADVI